MINAQIGPREDYTSVFIRIGKKDGASGTYPVLLEITGWRSFPPFDVQLDLDAITALNQQPENYGKVLGKALFGGDGLGKHYSETLAVCQGRGDGMRVRLFIDAPELEGLHWERIYHPLDGEWLPLGSTAATPFSRFVQPQQWLRPQPVTRRPLRVMAVIASPSNLTKFKLDPVTEAERQRLRDSFAQFPELDVLYLESGTSFPATLDQIREGLAYGCDIVHFLCHGTHSINGTALLLEKADGTGDFVETDRLVKAFKAVQSPPVFCFLTACESAVRERHDAFLPLGPALVEDGGVQAAVAMTDKVGVELAHAFTRQFYARLLNHGQIDLAMNEARALVQDKWDWGVPVLFSRLYDNQLLDFPVGQIYNSYLSHTDRAFQAVDEAMNAARVEEHGQELVRSLEELVKELSKSNGALVEVASNFRRTGQNPATFAQQFENFYYDFKDYYDKQTWVDEQTSCGRIADMSFKIVPRLAPLLNDRLMDQLRSELSFLSNADQDLLRHFYEYLDAMNQVVEEIWFMLNAGQIDEAIQKKRDFEAQISPSFQRSKKMFEQMTSSVRGVQAA
jgi:hypothetical protein